MTTRRNTRSRAIAAAGLGLIAMAGGAPGAAQGPHDDHEHHEHSPGAHVHGLAQLTVAQDAGVVEIAFSSAMWNLVGFERAPEGEAERAALAAAATALADPLTLFGVPASAGCAVTAAAPGLTLEAVDAGRAVADAHEDDHDHDHGHDHADDGEAGPASSYDVGDLTATWTLACAEPAQLRTLRPTLFTAFEKLETVEAAYIGERQRAATLTRNASDFQLP